MKCYPVLLLLLTACASPLKRPYSEVIVLPEGTKILLPRGVDPTELRLLSGEPTNRVGRVVEMKVPSWLGVGEVR